MHFRAHPAERIAWLGSFAIGIIASAYGAALPALAHELSRNYAVLSLLFVVLASGNTAAYFSANPLVDRFGPSRILQVGLVLFLLGGAALGLARSFPAWMLTTFGVGVGFALIDVGASRMVGEIHRPQSASAMNRLNIFFGLGAISAPLIVSLSVHLGGGPQPVFLLVGLLGAAGAAALLRIKPPPAAPAPHIAAGDSFFRYFGRARWLQLLTMIVFLYIAAEAGFGSWIAAYVHLRAGVSTALAALYPASYQVGLTVVRLLVGGSLATWRLERVLVVGGAVAMAGSLLAALGGANPWLGLIGSFLAGVGFAPAFPVAFGIAGARAPGREGWTYSAIFSALAMAALIAPWSEGQIFSNLPMLALLVTPILAAVMIICSAVLERVYTERSV